jgi:hypothetical protein
MSIFGKIAGWFIGGGAKKAASVVDEYVYTSEEKAQDDKEGVQEARKYKLADTHEDWFNRLIDAVNRIPRPLIILYTFFGVIGVVTLPDLSDMNPYWLTVFERIIYFLFGTRFIAKDVPKMLTALVTVAQKWKKMKSE